VKSIGEFWRLVELGRRLRLQEWSVARAIADSR
jgi:hypothetical protein